MARKATVAKEHGLVNLKDFGEGILVSGTNIVDKPPEIISVAPALDWALGGGLMTGSLVIMAGEPRCGKSVTALHFGSKWQALGRKLVYGNAEHRLQQRDLLGINGLKPEEMDIIQSSNSEFLTTQKWLQIIETYLDQKNVCFILDSASILCEAREYDGGVGTETRGGAGKLFASFCRRMAPFIPINNNILICIAHLYSNTSGKGFKTHFEAIGSKLQYALSTKMYAEHFKGITQDTGRKNAEGEKEEEHIGQTVFWKVERTPIGSPNKKAISTIRYGIGIDEVVENVFFASQLGLISKNASWYKLNFVEDTPNIQGEDNVRQYFIEHPDQYEHMAKTVREMLYGS